MKKTICLIFAVIALILIAFLAGKCSTRKERSQNVVNLAASRDSIKTYSVKIDGLKNSVYEKNAIILSQEQSIEAGIIERERLKKLHIKDLLTNTDLSGIVNILRDSLKLPPEVRFITIHDSSGVYPAVRLPYEFLYSDKYVSLTTGIRLNKTGYFDLSVPFSGTISIGYIHSGFLKTKPVGIYTTENPYIKINKMDVLIIKENKKFYQKTWFHFLAGGLIVETGHQLLK